MKGLISRGCFKHCSIHMAYRKYRNLVGFLLVTMATFLVLEVTFGKWSILNTRGSSTSKVLKVLQIQRQTTALNKEDTIKPASVLIDQEVTPSCYPSNLRPDEIKTPFKFYIYDLPSKFNDDIQKHMSMDKKFAFCYDLMYCGAGKELNRYYNKNGKSLFLPYFNEKSIYSNFTFSIRDTQQFSLEVVIHYKLLHSKYRTTDPKRADMFYIPAYTGLKCLQDRQNAKYFIKELFDYLKTNVSKYFYSGKPHFSTLSKIQREQGSELCPTLRQPESENITYIAIEKESNPGWAKSGLIFGKSIILAPYPSYIHFAGVKHDKTLLEYQGKPRHLKNSQFRLNVPTLSDRNVLLFFAAGSRRSNPFRAQIIDQFPLKTRGSHEAYIKEHGNIIKGTNSSTLHQVMLITEECSTSHRTTTIPWMMNSIFCVQPPGDSPTRKSFYDSILSGCIPIIFNDTFSVDYPFEDFMDYSDFTITIDAKSISEKNQMIIDIVSKIPSRTVSQFHKNLIRVAKWFQYSLSDGNYQEDDDAVALILQQLQDLYKI